MTLEAGKEMDKLCVLNWINEVYSAPSRAFDKYTEDELKMFAHDAYVLLMEHRNEYENGFNDAMFGKQELMYEDVDGKWHKKDW